MEFIEKSSEKTEKLRMLSFGQSLNETCTFPSVTSSEDLESQKFYETPGRKNPSIEYSDYLDSFDTLQSSITSQRK